MGLLYNLYEKVLGWSRHRHATRYLGLVSFVDSSVFPISPLFMLIPMTFALPKRAFYYATITAVSSILGGILGYFLGLFVFEAVVHPFLTWMGYMSAYQLALDWFYKWGFWAILIGCFTPFIPFKIFTLGAGVLHLHLGWFLMCASIGRFLRFFVIAAVIKWGGPKMEPFVRRTLAR